MFDHHHEADYATDGSPLMTVAEAAEFLRVSRSKVYGLMDGGALVYVKLGRCRRIPRPAVVELLERSIVGGWNSGRATVPLPSPKLAAQPTTAPQARRRTPPPRPPRPRRVS